MRANYHFLRAVFRFPTLALSSWARVLGLVSGLPYTNTLVLLYSYINLLLDFSDWCRCFTLLLRDIFSVSNITNTEIGKYSTAAINFIFDINILIIFKYVKCLNPRVLLVICTVSTKPVKKVGNVSAV